jgi:hypothetical protein
MKPHKKAQQIWRKYCDIILNNWTQKEFEAVKKCAIAEVQAIILECAVEDWSIDWAEVLEELNDL